MGLYAILKLLIRGTEQMGGSASVDFGFILFEAADQVIMPVDLWSRFLCVPESCRPNFRLSPAYDVYRSFKCVGSYERQLAYFVKHFSLPLMSRFVQDDTYSMTDRVKVAREVMRMATGRSVELGKLEGSLDAKRKGYRGKVKGEVVVPGPGKVEGTGLGGEVEADVMVMDQFKADHRRAMEIEESRRGLLLEGEGPPVVDGGEVKGGDFDDIEANRTGS